MDLQPAAISDFITGVARGDSWTLDVVDARIDEAPFDRIATYWAASPHSIRMAIARGIESYFSQIHATRDGLSEAGPLDQVAKVLGFCIYIIPDIDAEMADELLPFLRWWLEKPIQPHCKLAATVLASTTTLESLEALEDVARRLNFPDWILPALIERRAKGDVLGLFKSEGVWLPAATRDPQAFGTLGGGIERLISTDAGQAAAILSKVLDNHPGEVGGAIQNLLAELDLSNLPSIEAILPRPAAPRRLDLPASHLLAELEALKLNSDDETLDEQWGAIYGQLNQNSEQIDHLWKHVCIYTTQMATNEGGEEFIHSLRRSILSYPTENGRFRPAELLRRAQRDFYLSKIAAQAPRNAEDEKVLLRRLRQRVKIRSIASDVPRRLRIPIVYYAEEAYLELFCLLVQAHFGHFEHFQISREPNIAWDELLGSLQRAEVDLGLNNDDILLGDHAETEVPIARLGGEPLYRIENFAVLAREEFLLHYDIDEGLIERARAPRRNVFEGDLHSLHEPVLAKLINAGRISVPRGTFLETKMREFAKKNGIDERNVSAEASDIGLANFFSGETHLYFGGRLQTNYAFSACRNVVQLGELTVPIQGRLFTSRSYLDEYPKFMSDLAVIVGELNYALNGVLDKPYRNSLERVLPLRLNAAVLRGSEDAIATVGSFDDVDRALSQGVLTKQVLDRQWQTWTANVTELPAHHGRRNIDKDAS